ncbi:ATP-dependent DNA ligase [Streptomyces sp. NPDC055817]
MANGHQDSSGPPRHRHPHHAVGRSEPTRSGSETPGWRTGSPLDRSQIPRNPRAFVWDVLQHPTLGDVRPRPYSERRALMLDLLEDIGPPIQALPATDVPETALLWYEALRKTGVEGIVCKRAEGAYRGGKRSWLKLRHSDTVDAEVVGYTGPAARPRALAVRLPGGRIALSQTLPGPLAAHLGALLAGSGPPRRAHTAGGDAYNTVAHGLVVVEVLSGTTRHAVVTVTRLR